MQMLFDKINNGSPFGVIREVFSFSPQIRQFLNNKCHFITLPPLQTPVEIEEHRKNTTFDQNYNSLHYRRGKIVGKKIISDALLSVVSCCFMDDKNLKDLKKLLSQDQINLSNAITMTINNANAFEINEINLTSAIIDKIEYHFRDNTFHFIFDVSNNFYFYKYIDILYQRGFLYTDRRLKE
ncbi:hypothetical protein UBN117_11780 [Helicobacter pylori]